MITKKKCIPKQLEVFEFILMNYVNFLFNFLLQNFIILEILENSPNTSSDTDNATESNVPECCPNRINVQAN
ncbi:hypothetical protein LOD99_6087 [Oopsacas minuta]|uniref:Uncharacterized protein n=1 Tax=Oopsacas minuta TaxID=111878 RepID=A0AAV7JP00_9METZ|nr:hypothetical protein LOD99_6087 [Oopsacas minuta]